MFSVYSNYLDPLKEAGIVDLTDNPKPSEIYNQLRNAYNQGVEGILDNIRMIAPIEEGEDYYDIIQQHDSFKRWLHWVNKKITLEIGKETYRTLGVRLRIATGMLNNLVDNHIMSITAGINIHLNLVENVERETSLVTNEDLPF